MITNRGCRSAYCYAPNTILFADGTFKISPKGFKQLYTVHGIDEKNISFPVAYILTQNKSAVSIRKIFEKIKERSITVGLRLQPELVIIDFELAVRNAL